MDMRTEAYMHDWADSEWPCCLCGNYHTQNLSVIRLVRSGADGRSDCAAAEPSLC